MRKGKLWLLAPAALLAACGRSDKARIDDGLQNDLSLASQAQPYQAQQLVSPAEAGYGVASGAGALQTGQSASRGPYSRPAAQPAARRRGSSAGSSSGGYYPSIPAEPVRHTGRDAAVGAAAGAIIGASTSRDKVKGGLIGAAAGAVLGGIIGHTVDVDRKP